MRITVPSNLALALVSIGVGVEYKVSSGYYAAYGLDALRRELPVLIAFAGFCVVAAVGVKELWYRSLAQKAPKSPEGN